MDKKNRSMEEKEAGFLDGLRAGINRLTMRGIKYDKFYYVIMLEEEMKVANEENGMMFI